MSKSDYTIHGFGASKGEMGAVCFSKVVRVEHEYTDTEEVCKTKAIARFFELARQDRCPLAYHSILVVAVSWGRRNQGGCSLCSPVSARDCLDGVDALAAQDPRSAEEIHENIKEITSAIFAADTKEPEETEKYGKVPKEVTKLWDILCAKWLQGKITRTLVKRPVMTYPYAVSEYGVRKQLTKIIKEMVRDGSLDVPYEHASKIAFMLKGPVFSAVRAEVWAAARAMDWLKEVVTAIGKTKLPAMWRSPIGFPVVQAYKEKKTKEVTCRVGKIRIRANVTDSTDKIDNRAQASAIAPNFVHSCDASHLQMTVLNCCRQGIKHFHMIHDSYGTHAGNATALAATLRTTFIDMYTEDVLKNFVDGIKAYLPEGCDVELPEPPPKGDFDLNQISCSRYFFI